MLINSTELLQKARKESSCIAAFNVYNLESIQAAFKAAKNRNVPLIIAFGEGYLSHASFDTITAVVRSLDRDHGLPVVLHLDHCKKLENIEKAIEAGFTSVMYDGSMLPLEENIKNTRIAACHAHAAGVSIEGELGRMNPEDGTPMDGEADEFTDPGQAQKYAAETGIDSLAVSIGNVHGLYKGIPNLNFRRLQEIWDAVRIPLVLHGCSGIPEEQIKTAISIAVSKINVNTEIALAASDEARTVLSSGEHVRFDALMTRAEERMRQVMEKYIDQLRQG